MTMWRRWHSSGQYITQTIARPDVWGTFRALGFEINTRREPFRLLFDEGKLRGNVRFQ
jgi:hypothetical protein